VNNAGIALRPTGTDPQSSRENFNATFNTTGRASLTRSSTGKLPPTAVVSYSVSKAAVNSLTIELQKSEDALMREDFEQANVEGKEAGRGRVEFFAANPGHCKTAFNGFKGTKNPLDGAEVIVRLVNGEGKKGGFWEFEEGVLRLVPW